LERRLPPDVLKKGLALNIPPERLSERYVQDIIDKEMKEVASLEDRLRNLASAWANLDRRNATLKRRLYNELNKNQMIAIGCGARYASNSMIRAKNNLKPRQMADAVQRFRAKYLDLGVK
jgi:hypothetical protein